MITQERIETNQLLMEMVGLDLTSKSLTDNLQAERYYTLITEHIESQIQSAINWIDSDSAREFFFNDAYHQAEIWDSLEDDWDNILSGKYETIDDLLEEVYDYGKSRGYSDMAETLRYTPTDRLAFAFARNYNYGLIQNLDNDLRGAIKDRMTRAAIQGENPYSLAPHLRKLGLTQLPGSTFTPYQRAVLIARTEISRIQNTGILQSYVNEGYTRVKILTACDDNVCTICLKYAFEYNENDKVTYENRGPELVHDIKTLLKGKEYPPFHPQCYMPDTEVFTDHGWKYFQDLNDNDKILSMNPETGVTEFLKPNKLIVHENTYGYMYHIHNKWFDTCVTPDHDCFIHQRREQKGKKVFVPEFRKPSDLNSESYFLRTVENNNISPASINVNGLKFEATDYAFFMAWYLSEGSVLHNPETAKAKSYPIKITQQITENREIIQPIFEKIAKYLGIKLYVGKEYFEFHSKELHDYLVVLGKSHEKYIPEELFGLSRDDLNVFLENYVRGDGHSRIKSSNVVNDSKEEVIFTSSVNLVNDLSYVILLAGYYPSITLMAEKGTVSNHHNDSYAQNYDSYSLRINRSKHARVDGCSVDKISYDGMVYCVELPKYHTLWTKRNGKTSWNGNCRCTYLSVWEGKVDPNTVEPYTVNLTPLTEDELIDLAFNEFGSWNDFGTKQDLKRLKDHEGWKPLNGEDIPNYLPKTLRDNIISFEDQSSNFEDGNEWAQVCNLTSGKIYEIMTDHKPDRVNPFRGKDYGDDEVAMVHNHPDGTFLSPKDFSSGFYNNNNIKYLVTHTDNYIYIAQINNIPNATEFKQFIKEYDKIRVSSSPNDCWNMLNSNPITKKYISVDLVVKL